MLLNLLVIIFCVVWGLFVVSLFVYFDVYNILKKDYPHVWDRVFSSGNASSLFWNWISENNYPEITDRALKRKLYFINRSYWVISSGFLVCLLLFFILYLFK